MTGIRQAFCRHGRKVAKIDQAEARGLHEIKAVWENSTKHVQSESIYNVEEAKAAIEMANLLKRIE